jgi:GDP-4-dehydro-6-deoxy-D-mannose reductase
MKALITGAAGFVGGHLARHLIDLDYSVAGVVLPREARKAVETLPSEVSLIEADILDDERLNRAFADWEPGVVFHLAAFSNPESSWAQARQTLEVNILGSHNVLQAAVETGVEPRVLLVGSSQQYGHVAESDQPMREELPQKPLTPYAVSKASQELLGQRFFLSEQLPVLMVRSFNHTGPGQSASYVCSNFARQIAEIESGLREPKIEVGNLSARRDFTDVRDVVRAYVQIAESGNPGEPYNVCRGEALSIQHILDALLEQTDADVVVRVDMTRYHVLDAPLILGDNSRLRFELGWEPAISLEQTLSDLLNFWRIRLRT